MKGLGQRIQFLRKQRKITLVEMAKKTSIDQATLSRMENEKMVGTLDSHMRIAQALGLRLPDLYEEAAQKMDESRDNEMRQKLETFSHSSGAVSELLTTGILQKKMMPVLMRLKPKSFSATEDYPPLTERFIYVLKGSVELTINREQRKLDAGDSLYFTASVPHSFKNTAKTDSELVSVITPTSL